MHVDSTFRPTLRFRTLSQFTGSRFDDYLEKVVKWFTAEWGYIYDKGKSDEKALEDRKNYLRDNANNIHLAFYKNFLVGTFRIEQKEYEPILYEHQKSKGIQANMVTSEVWFIYVDSKFRGLGCGQQLVEKIKELSRRQMNATMVVLDTLKPSLIGFYKNKGAKVLCQHHIDLNPTDVMSIKL